MSQGAQVGAAAAAMGLELLARGLPVTFVARGRSMWPALRDGDRVRVTPLTRAPRAGDVVFARVGDFVVLHRVLWVRRDGAVLLKGDARRRVDGWFSPRAVWGTVDTVERRGRSVDAGRLGGWARSVTVGAVRAALHR